MRRLLTLGAVAAAAFAVGLLTQPFSPNSRARVSAQVCVEL
jgi:hypothetical protein